MTKLCVEDVVGPCAITLASAIQLGVFAKKVGEARTKFKVPPPQLSDDENFMRVYRAHQNTVEWNPILMGSLWSAALITHQVPACFFGAIYIVGRQMYFSGYSQAADKRMAGFRVSLVGIQGLMLCSFMGLAHQGFIAFTGKSIFEYAATLF